MVNRKRTHGTLVIGMGRFGAAVAVTLEQMGFEVLAVEKNRARAQHYSTSLPIVQGDATDVSALEQVGATDFASAVVGVGTSIEASVLITANLSDLGVKSIWAKAISREHGRILQRIGAHHVVYPEYDAGQRTAHLVGGQLLDYIEIDQEEFVVAKMFPPRELSGLTLEAAQIRSKHDVNVIGVMKPQGTFKYATKSTVVDANDVLVVSGTSTDVIRFSERPH